MERVLIVLAVSYVFLIGSASALSVETFVSAGNGSISINQSVNNGALEISLQTNETAGIFMNLTGSDINFSINGSGQGVLGLNASGNISIDSEADGRRETVGGYGIFSGIFEFFRKIVLFGWVTFK